MDDTSSAVLAVGGHLRCHAENSQGVIDKMYCQSASDHWGKVFLEIDDDFAGRDMEDKAAAMVDWMAAIEVETHAPDDLMRARKPLTNADQ